jgi:eukaryotic-like serine/threonine-protein kinase
MKSVDVGALVAGRYRLEERLDVGGRAQVWRAVDQELERPVAVKILLTPEGGDSSFLEAFRAQAQLEARLQHPGIVEVFDWGHDEDTNFVVMELIEGRTLRARLEQGVLLNEGAISVGRQLAAALAYAHAEGVAHGSINAEHVMVSPDGRATLIDFGLQCHGVCEYPALPDSDTYSLGQLLYEALIGAKPSGPRPVNLPENLDWPAPPRKLNPNVWGKLENVVMKAISPKVEDRYPTAADLQADLDELAKPKSRIASLVLMGLMALMIVGVSIWYFGTQARIVVPDVTGMPTEQAQSTLSSAGLKMVVTQRVASTSVATGTVMSEDPPAGSETRRGSSVRIVVSTGRAMTTVPSLIGISLEAASSSVASAGLVVGTVVTQNSDAFPANAIASQSPEAGTQLTAGSSVTLIVSAGQARATVPDVSGLSQSQATAKLDDAGLVADVTTVYSNLPSGIVVSQGPTAGATVAKGSSVAISISRGPAPVRVPNVVGAKEADAVKNLQDVGLVPVSVPTSGTSSQVGNVISQSPTRGTAVAPGSQVRIRVGQ